MVSLKHKRLINAAGLYCTRQREIREAETEGEGEEEEEGDEDFVFHLDKSILIDEIGLVVFEDHALAKGPDYIFYQGLYGGRSVAVKVIKPGRTGFINRIRKERFEREVKVLSKLQNTNIVKFVGASVNPSMLILTEHMRGGTLQKYLLEIRPAVLDLKLSLSLALDICRAMKYLHENGIIYRDLTPFNLLLSEDKRTLKLGDFGLAREMEGSMTNEAGTYRWMAPECYHKEAYPRDAKKDYDHKADVYSFSIVLWQLLTNKFPFDGRTDDMLAAYDAANNIRPSLDGIHQELIPVLESCWAENPKDRPEFRDVREHILEFYQAHFLNEISPASIAGITPADEDDITEITPASNTGTTSGNVDGITEITPANGNIPSAATVQVDEKKENKQKKKRSWLRRLFCYAYEEERM